MVHGTTVGRTHSREQWIGAHAQPLHEMRQACVCRWPVASLSPALSRFELGSKTIAGMVVKYRHPAERSVYEGGATRRWLKVKQKDWTVEEDGWRISVAQPAP
jgi:hypothetical protein